MNALKGWKTYLVAAGVVIVAGLHATGYIDDAVYTLLMGLLGAGGLSTMRAAVAKAEK